MRRADDDVERVGDRPDQRGHRRDRRIRSPCRAQQAEAQDDGPALEAELRLDAVRVDQRQVRHAVRHDLHARRRRCRRRGSAARPPRSTSPRWPRRHSPGRRGCGAATGSGAGGRCAAWPRTASAASARSRGHARRRARPRCRTRAGWRRRASRCRRATRRPAGSRPARHAGCRGPPSGGASRTAPAAGWRRWRGCRRRRPGPAVNVAMPQQLRRVGRNEGGPGHRPAPVSWHTRPAARDVPRGCWCRTGWQAHTPSHQKGSTTRRVAAAAATTPPYSLVPVLASEVPAAGGHPPGDPPRRMASG